VQSAGDVDPIPQKRQGCDATNFRGALSRNRLGLASTISLLSIFVAAAGVSGADAQVPIYTEHWEHLSLLRKILLRMRSWENYVFLEGH
jgi:hypothetical protein